MCFLYLINFLVFSSFWSGSPIVAALALPALQPRGEKK